ncbi:hypothetical protein CPB86DRAFT_783346 [Serendipita vermifera]|nr:hypothetical protein CPB86DRAFT_783346 [Serendipita vermifera]
MFVGGVLRAVLGVVLLVWFFSCPSLRGHGSTSAPGSWLVPTEQAILSPTWQVGVLF